MANEHNRQTPDRHPDDLADDRYREQETGRDQDDLTSGEDLGRQQAEGNLGNERQRDSGGTRNRDDEGRSHDSGRLPD